MKIRWLKYLSPLLFIYFSWVSFHQNGWLCYLPVIFAFVFVPLAEFFLKPSSSNLNVAEEELVKNDPVYDALLYLFFFLHYALLIIFLLSLKDQSLSVTDISGRIISMGILCGVFGINLAHELGHRSNKTEQFLSKALLLTSLYMHFFIEHNKGHHKRVATQEDPASARFNEPVFSFYLRTIKDSYLSAWQIANKEMLKRNLPALHWKNEMLQYHFIQLAFLILIGFVFGVTTLACFFLAALLGILLLECINYIEHYGLMRNEISPGKYERAMPHHSWNSNHIIGRMMLFELSRHSDHHYLASRKYQVLRHHEDSPQMPTGYPGMMVLANIPPLWFRIMNKRIQQFHK